MSGDTKNKIIHFKTTLTKLNKIFETEKLKKKEKDYNEREKNEYNQGYCKDVTEVKMSFMTS